MKLLYIVYIFFLFTDTYLHAQDLDIRVTGRPPYSIYWQDYQDLDNFNINIRNKTNRAIEFETLVSISSPENGISGSSLFADCSQTLIGGQFKLFTRQNIEDLCLAIKLADIEMPQDVKTDILLSGVLPEGEYQICISAIEPNNNNKVYGNGCLRFKIIHPERPILNNPKPDLNNVFDGSITPNYIITWNHSINNPSIRSTTTYNLKIIDLGLKSDDGENLDQHPIVNKEELMEEPGNGLVLYEKNISQSSFLINVNDLNMVDKHQYAVRVYAVNDEHPLANDLRSEIGVFHLLLDFDLECGQQFNITPASPSQIAYTIPFTQVPLVIRLEPYCDKYRSFNYTTTLVNANTNQLVYSLNRKPKWDSGPRNYLNVYLHRPNNRVSGFDPDGYYSSHLALGDLTALPILSRGQEYKWTTQGTLEYETREGRPTRKMTNSMNPILFQIGMPKNKLTSPINGIAVDTGVVNFELGFNEIIQPPLPPFKIIQFDDNNNIVNYPPRVVNEYGVLQVSKFKDFKENILAKGHLIKLNESEYYNQEKDDRMLNTESIMNALYSNIRFDGRFTDTATYYWRFGWYKNPDELPTENNLLLLTSNDFYNTSTIDSFKIGDTVKTVSSPIAEQPLDTVCGSSCTINAPENTTLIPSLSSNDEIIIGKFLAKLTEVTKSGSGYNGKARIKIPFLNNVTIKVNFTNLKVNTNKIVYDGEMIAEAGGTELESIANIVFDQPMQLPLGWDATVKGRHTILALTYMKFLPIRADMTASINFGDLLPEHMALPEQAELSGTFCFHPGGFSETMVFHLSEDLTFDDNNSGYGFLLKGGAATDTATMSYIKWACKGFESFQLAGEILLSESLLNKDSGLESNDEPISGRVKAGFKFKYIHDESANATDNGFLLQANMDAFQFKDFEGWGFDSDTIYIDWSDSENPPGFTVPQGYTYSGMNDPQLKNGWEGIYIPRLKTLTPKDFGRGVNTRTVFSGSSLVFGEGKYHVSLKATNIFNDSWARMRAKMDTIQGVISSDEKLIRFKGGLLLPFTDTTSWLDFGGHFSGFDSIHLYVAIAGYSVHMEDLPIEFKFDNTSLLNIVRGADRTFRANAWFNGVMDLESSIGPSSSSLSSLKYSGIKFENLGYKSGVGFESGDFSFASPQKTMNGFPIQIDSIDFVSEGGYQGFYFKPKIVLVGDVNGFSASTGLNLLFKFNYAGSYDVIQDTKLELKDVELDVAVSGFELKGRLAFINTETDKGMEGILAAKLPSGIAAHLKAKFGTKTTNDNAAFNTAANFSYWYVDGMVTFGANGIPMFAGMSLYGIGGGLWYHMTQDPITSKSYEGLVGAATDTANLNYSGIKYQPNFNSNYGMKLQGLFGSENEGKTYNMLLAVWAQFNANGGPNVGLDGDMRFMSESVAKLASGEAETTKKNVWGDVHFVYNGQEHFVQGNLGAYANITVGDNKIFYGKLPGDKIVDAEFYAGPSDAGNRTWYLKIGTPEAKAGAVFDLRIKKTDISAYLMVGHGIPNETPAPDPGFMAMLNGAEEGYIGGSTASATNKPIVYSATGIAAGVLIKDTFAFHYQPFYLDVDAIIGADINVTQEDERKCVESQETPGIDGWYGTGQLYAGIQGVFGIYVDIWFIEGKFEFLKGSIALLMNGGLPNPSWFYAKGAFKYKVIGLIEGTHAMEISVGDKCTVGSNSPFGDMKVIQDLHPADNARDVSVYVKPKALVSPYVGHELEVFDVDLNKSRIFRVNWASNVLKQGNTTVPSNLDLTDGSEIYMPPISALNDLTWYSLQIKVTASEKINNAWTPVANFEERDTTRFKTGIMPDEIVPEVLSNTYPIVGQNYFLKDEISGAPGYTVLNQQVERLLYTSKDTGGMHINFRYEAQFFKGNETTPLFKRTIQIENFKYLKYNVSALLNNTIYKCKIVRVREVSATAYAPSNVQMGQQTASAIPPNASVTNIRQEGYKTIGDIEYKLNNTQDIRDARGQSVNLGYKIIPQKFMRIIPTVEIPHEHVLLEYRFKTSKYNTLAQKIGNKTWSAGKYTIDRIDYLNASTYLDEPFDQIDLQGHEINNNNGERVPSKPLVSFGSNIENNGEDMGDNLYSYLPFDAIIIRNKESELYKLPKDLSNFLDPPNAPTINAGLSPEWNLTTLQIRFRDTIPQYPNIKIFEPPIGKAPLSQSPSPVQGASAVAIPNGGAVQVAVSPGAGPTNNFSIKFNHGRQMYRLLRKNKSILSDVLNRTATSFEDIMNWIKSKNPSIESRLSAYLLTTNHGRFECVPQSKMGIIYLYPKMNIGQYEKTSSLAATVNITCPPLPQID